MCIAVTTKLDRYLKRNHVSTAKIVRATGYHRNHVSRVRKGQTEPTRECIAAIFDFIQKEIDREVSVDDLFEFTPKRRKAS